MTVDRTRLPDPLGYYEAQGLTFRERRGKWRTAGCPFHGSSDSLRVNTESGAFICMAGCGARGGDVLAFHRAIHGVDFVPACRELGAWIDDGKPEPKHSRPAPFSARDALRVLRHDAVLTAVAAANVAYGVILSDADRSGLLKAAARIQYVVEVAA